jgi:hypothetical protein
VEKVSASPGPAVFEMGEVARRRAGLGRTSSPLSFSNFPNQSRAPMGRPWDPPAISTRRDSLLCRASTSCPRPRLPGALRPPRPTSDAPRSRFRSLGSAVVPFRASSQFSTRLRSPLPPVRGLSTMPRSCCPSPGCCSGRAGPPFPPPHAAFLRRLHHFLDLYEDGVYPDPAGVACQAVLHSAIGAAALKQRHTITDLLDEAGHSDDRHPADFPASAQNSLLRV